MKRTEYPDPQFERKNWICLNGMWEFEIDNNKTGFERGLLHKPLSQRIEVPFCPESVLSGIGYTDFIYACWYRKYFHLTQNQIQDRIMLRFGAVDYAAKIYINGQYVCGHNGGYTPFAADITKFVNAGKNEVVVYVEDDITANVPSGKQSFKESHGCFYTRVTGIWQSVWIEFTPEHYLKSVKYFPNVKNGTVDVETIVQGHENLTVRIFYCGKLMGEESVICSYKKRVTVFLKEKYLWEPGKGELYDVEITFGKDKVYSYFGLREVACKDGMVIINGNPFFQKLVLDQGYYPDGIYTAKDSSEFVRDIKISTDLGFNGARLHQKVFEPRFLYECDKAGYVVWGEMPSWGIHCFNLEPLGNFISEWGEVIERDFNHPCIIAWCPLNEMWEDYQNKELICDIRFSRIVYNFTKEVDPTRPSVDASGGYHSERTDIFDVHCYQDASKMQACLNAVEKGEMIFGKVFAPNDPDGKYAGQFICISEYGGRTFSRVKNLQVSTAGEVAHVENTTGWGYVALDGEETFVNDFIALTDMLFDCSKVCGFCYTQLYDVEQEQNGFYTYERNPKISEISVNKILKCMRRDKLWTK